MNENVERFIAKSEWQLKLGFKSVPLLVWGLLSVLMLVCWPTTLFWVRAGIFMEALAVGLGIAFITERHLCALDRRKAYLIWLRLRNAGHWNRGEVSTAYGVEFEPSNSRLPAQEFGTTIEKLLLADQSGRILPLAQAVRLMDTFQRQQQHMRSLNRRRAEIAPLRKSISLKMEQLRDLQEASPAGVQSLRELDDDERAIHELKEQIQSSCGRLEIILLTLKNAVRVRDLHHEVASLSQRAAPQIALLDSVNEGEVTIPLGDIERQISFEIETYLQLERETSRHLN